MDELRSLARSFICAARGVFAAIQHERNLRIHLCVTFYVVFAGFLLELSPTEWVLILLCIGIVLSAELGNTAIEKICDFITRNHSSEIKFIKDCAAGAVLISAILAAVAGCLIFLPKITFQAIKPALGVTVVTLPAFLYFIFRRRTFK